MNSRAFDPRADAEQGVLEAIVSRFPECSKNLAQHFDIAAILEETLYTNTLTGETDLVVSVQEFVEICEQHKFHY